MSMTQWSMLSGAIFCTLILFLIIKKTGNLEKTDIGILLGIFVTGSGIPKGLFICYFCFTKYEQLKPTELVGYEKEIFLAGLALLAASAVTIWGAVKQYTTVKDG